MKVKVKEDRKVYIIKGTDTATVGTQNENDATELNIVVPEQYQDFNKKIVFITDDGVVWDIIENNTYKSTKSITKNKIVKFYIWLTKGEQDFRSEEKTLIFNKNIDANEEMTDEEINSLNKLFSHIDSLENILKDILKVIQNGGYTSTTISEIEKLIVSYFETKTVGEVET